MNFELELTQTLRAHSDPEKAAAMSAYMKNNFPFVGIKNENRKALLKPIYVRHKPEVKSNFRQIALKLWQLPEREFHYCAMEILTSEIKGKFEEGDSSLIEKMLVSQSWWDSVDALAKHLLGNYLLAFPKAVPEVIKRFSDSENMWLNRSAILFQLGYKSKTDAEILFAECRKHAHSTEFFIRKAIGWALREYAKTNPEAVVKFVSENQLSGLSAREALKNL